VVSLSQTFIGGTAVQALIYSQLTEACEDESLEQTVRAVVGTYLPGW